MKMRIIKTYTLKNENQARAVVEAVNHELFLQQISNKYQVKPR